MRPCPELMVSAGHIPTLLDVLHEEAEEKLAALKKVKTLGSHNARVLTDHAEEPPWSSLGVLHADAPPRLGGPVVRGH